MADPIERHNLSSTHHKFLNEWAAQDVGMGFHFKALESRTCLPRDTIRNLCRDLAAAGFLEFSRGCFTEDGDPYGSAYVLTQAGRDFLSQEDDHVV